jgi:membrane protease YdiL (CAAX protease family)
MKSAGLFAVVLGAAALVWMLLPALHPAARVWTALLMVPFPALMVRQAQELKHMRALPRVPAYLSSIFSLWVLCGATLAVTLLSGLDARDLGLREVGIVRVATVTVVVTAAAIGLLFAFRAAGARETTVLRELLPVTTRERWVFVLVAITAGICEEIVFRGFLLRTLTLGTGLTPLAVALSAGAFGVVHAYQSAAGALRAAILGVLLTVPVLLDASLLSSIIAHTLIDLLSGLWLARYLLR